MHAQNGAHVASEITAARSLREVLVGVGIVDLDHKVAVLFVANEQLGCEYRFQTNARERESEREHTFRVFSTGNGR